MPSLSRSDAVFLAYHLGARAKLVTGAPDVLSLAPIWPTPCAKTRCMASQLANVWGVVVAWAGKLMAMDANVAATRATDVLPIFMTFPVIRSEWWCELVEATVGRP